MFAPSDTSADRQAQFGRTHLIYSIISLFLPFVNSLFAKSLLIFFVNIAILELKSRTKTDILHKLYTKVYARYPYDLFFWRYAAVLRDVLILFFSPAGQPLMTLKTKLPILKCIADDTEWLFFVLFPPPKAGETIHNQIGI